MSYVKQTWATGDVIIAEKLNHMEDGIEAVGGLIVYVNCTPNEADPDTFLDTDLTYTQIANAVNQGKIVMCIIEDKIRMICINRVLAENKPIVFSGLGIFTANPNAELIVDGVVFGQMLPSAPTKIGYEYAKTFSSATSIA